MSINILLVDDDPIVSASLQTILEASGEVSVLAIGANGNQAVGLYKEHQPEILLMDIQMPEKDGLEAAEEILSEFPQAKILFLTTFSDDAYIAKALSLGVKGYILKQEFAGILPSLKAVLSGQNVFGTEIVSKFSPLEKSPKKPSFGDFGLSEKEGEMITLIAQGLNNKEISEQMFLSEGTVRNYLSGVLEKLELRDRTQVAVFYYKNLQ